MTLATDKSGEGTFSRTSTTATLVRHLLGQPRSSGSSGPSEGQRGVSASPGTYDIQSIFLHFTCLHMRVPLGTWRTSFPSVFESERAQSAVPVLCLLPPPSSSSGKSHLRSTGSWHEDVTKMQRPLGLGFHHGQRVRKNRGD